MHHKVSLDLKFVFGVENNNLVMKKFAFFFFSFSVSIVFSQEKGTFTDTRDGKVYKTVVIGAKTWMAENLNVSTFRNGDTIPEVKNAEEWLKAGKEGRPAWCYFKNKKKNGKKYGKLYNWHAVSDSRGLAISGYHIPSHSEMTELENFLQKDKKNIMITGRGAKSGFRTQSIIDYSQTGPIEGGISFSGDNNGIWWCSSEIPQGSSHGHGLFSVLLPIENDSENLKTVGNLNNAAGFSVRCVKD